MAFKLPIQQLDLNLKKPLVFMKEPIKKLAFMKEVI
jgi:hypothetical protein